MSAPRIGEPHDMYQRFEPWQATPPVPPRSTVDVLSRDRYMPPPLAPPPQWLDPSASIGDRSLFCIDGFWPRIIVGFMVGGALAVFIPILFAR